MANLSGAGRVSMPDSAIRRCISSASAWVAKRMSLKSKSARMPASEYQPIGPAIRSTAAFHSAASADLKGSARLRRATSSFTRMAWLLVLRRAIYELR